MKPATKEKLISTAAIIAMFILLGIMIYDFIPLISEVLLAKGNETQLLAYVQNYGSKGIPILTGISFLQVIVTIIPGSLIQLLCGLCYGIFFGSIIYTVGAALGNCFVFILLRQFRNIFIFNPTQRLANNKILAKLNGLMNTENPAMLVFILYLLPGIPQILLPIFFARTKIKLRSYSGPLILALLPGSLIYCLIGDLSAKGHYVSALVMIICILLFTLIVFVNRDKILDRLTGR